MECPLGARNALADNLGVAVDQNGHVASRETFATAARGGAIGGVGLAQECAGGNPNRLFRLMFTKTGVWPGRLNRAAPLRRSIRRRGEKEHGEGADRLHADRDEGAALGQGLDLGLR